MVKLNIKKHNIGVMVHSQYDITQLACNHVASTCKAYVYCE